MTYQNSTNQNKICMHFMRNRCTRDDCKFIHDKDICKFLYNNGVCRKNSECNFKHEINGVSILKLRTEERKKKRIKNTESFEPDHSVADMRIMVGDSTCYRYNHIHSDNDVVIVPNLFCDIGDQTIYNNILKEVADENLWKLWHGDSHYIADDKQGWKKSSPTFNMVIQKMSQYFNMDVQATRLNWYKNTDEWKPFHHDAAAVKKDKAATQNITVGVSFGVERDVCFQHAKTKTTVTVPLVNGQIYTFGKDVNINWRHGIPQIHPSNKSDKGRISIIAWGWVD